MKHKDERMTEEEYEKSPLWKVLVDTAHALTLYPNHKAYVRDVMLHEKSDLTPKEIALKLNIPEGEAMVILWELKKERVISR